MAKTVVGMFKSTAEAERVKEQLVAQGFEARNITVMAQNRYDDDTIHSREDFAYGGRADSEVHTGFDGGYGITGESVSDTGLGSKTQSGTGSYERSGSRRDTEYGSGTDTYGTERTGKTHEGVGEKISHFFKSLVGDDDTTDRGHHHFQQGVNQGGALLAATVPDERADEVADLLREKGARDVDEENISDSGVNSSYAGTSGTRTAGTTGTGDAAGTMAGSSYMGTDYDAPGTRESGVLDSGRGSGEVRGMAERERSIPVVEEQVQVGKRAVNRGGVRIYSHMVERPVNENVTLREEHVRVERRPVDREATAADLNQKDQTIELRETSEEAVVGKTQRVVEEVVVSKEASERTESIQDTVRKTEVEVENLNGEDRFASQRSGSTGSTTGNR